jgi:Holliday junction DNA helicase RuvA
LSKDDLEVYKLLIAVNGIGPKGALSILSAMSADDLRFAIISGDAKAISKAQGVGSKSAERIILELKDKIKMFDSYGDKDSDALTGALSGDDTKNEARNEAIEALSALGYSPTDALKAVKRIEITEDMDSGAILKAALKVISTL